MLSNLGNILLFLNVILSLSIIYAANRNLKISGGVDKNIFQLSLIQSTSIIICFFVLIAAFIVSDFSLITVYQNSHSMKPIFYKITGTWGNHEGSLMLWVIILTIFSFLFLIYNKNHPKKFRLLTLIIQNILIIGFLFFIILNSNPFSPLSPIPKEGLGLKTGFKSSWEKAGYRKKSICEKCAFKSKHPAQMDVYHIDGNLKNASWNNLKTICANCGRIKAVEEIGWKQGGLMPDKA